MSVMSNTTLLTGPHYSSLANSGFSQSSTSQSVTNNLGIPGSATQLTHDSHSLHDTVIPAFNTIPANPTISQPVSLILSTLEASIRVEATQGKTTLNKYNRFNATDTVTPGPELRCPNERFHVVSGCKHTLYDNLTVREWAVGQV